MNVRLGPSEIRSAFAPRVSACVAFLFVTPVLAEEPGSLREFLGPYPSPEEAPVFSGIGGEGDGGFSARSARRTDAFADLAPFDPEDFDFISALRLRPLTNLTLHPTGVPWFLPGQLGTNRTGDKPGPGLGIDMSWMPSKQWRFGADLIVRADRIDANSRLYDWTPYLAPGFEYYPHPNSLRPFSVGLVAPLALRSHGENWSGCFLVIRWDEVLAKAAKNRR